MNDSLLWQVRHFVYNHFADTTFPPNVDETAAHFSITVEEAGEYYRELHNRHAFFLEPETLTVRMAWPFSAVPTIFKVRANGKTYYANCAWDMLGIPVLLQSDALLEGICTESNEAVQLEIKNGQITSVVTLSDSEGSLSSQSETLRSQQPLPHTVPASLRESDMLLIHYPIPFTHWFDNVVFT